MLYYCPAFSIRKEKNYFSNMEFNPMSLFHHGHGQTRFSATASYAYKDLSLFLQPQCSLLSRLD